MKRTTPTARLLTRTLGVLTLSALVLTACSDGKSTTTPTVQLPPLISVTSVKGDVRSQLLAAIYAQVLEDGGFRVARKDPVDMDRAAYYQAIQDGQFQLIPETTGSLLSFVFASSGTSTTTTSPSGPAGPATTQPPIIVTTTTEAPTTTAAPTTVAGADATTTTAVDVTGNSTVSSARKPSTTPTTTTDATTTGTDTVTSDSLLISPAPTDTTGDVTTTTEAAGNGRSAVEQTVLINGALPDKLIVNSGAAAVDQQIIACTATAMKNNSGFQLTSYTNLASIAPGITLGGSAEYLADKALGYPAFLQYYGGEFKKTVAVDDAGLADAVKNNTADCFAMNSLNPLITTEQMTILSDDRTLVPSNAMIALMDSTVATPEAIAALDAIGGSLTTERLNQMLNEITANGTPVATVAAAFLASI